MKKTKHKREPNPNANWAELLPFWGKDITTYPEVEIPHICVEFELNERKDELIMDCAPDCLQIYWYLKSHPKIVYWTRRETYDVDGFRYAHGDLDRWQYDVLESMCTELEMEYVSDLFYLLELKVDPAIKKIDSYLKALGMGR